MLPWGDRSSRPMTQALANPTLFFSVAQVDLDFALSIRAVAIRVRKVVRTQGVEKKNIIDSAVRKLDMFIEEMSGTMNVEHARAELNKRQREEMLRRVEIAALSSDPTSAAMSGGLGLKVKGKGKGRGKGASTPKSSQIPGEKKPRQLRDKGNKEKGGKGKKKQRKKKVDWSDNSEGETDDEAFNVGGSASDNNDDVDPLSSNSDMGDAILIAKPKKVTKKASRKRKRLNSDDDEDDDD